MEGKSVWLGAMRGPVRLAMIVFSALAALMFVWLVISAALLGGDVGMFEIIRPEGRVEAWVMLALVALATFFASLYSSDNIGAIEPEPHGFFDFLSLICARIAMIAVIAVVVVMFYEVVSRYVFSRPTLWANELSLWIAAFVFLLAGLYAMQQRSHIRIYVIYDMMPRWAQKASDVVSVLLIVGFTFALVWGGFFDAQRRWNMMEGFGTAWDPPIPATVKPAILIIITLVAIQSVSNLIADWNKAPEHHSPMDEIDETEIENIRKTLEEPK